MRVNAGKFAMLIAAVLAPWLYRDGFVVRAAEEKDLRAAVAVVPDVARTSKSVDAFAGIALDRALSDPFNPVVPPPPPPPPAAPPPPPQPPAFPFRYFGVMTDEAGKPVHFLVKGDALVPVKNGAVLGDGYRVEALTDRKIVVYYDPIPSRTEITVGSSAP